MPKCVEIELADDGSVRVGLQPYGAVAPPEQGPSINQTGQAIPPVASSPDAAVAPAEGVPGEGGDKPYLQPVASIDEALQKAKELLEGSAVGQAQPGAAGPQQTPMQAAQERFSTIRTGEPQKGRY